MADYENQNYAYGTQNDYNQDVNGTGYLQDKQEEGLLGKTRLGFIRKVYLILGAQLFLTVIMSVISMYSTGFSTFQQNNTWLLYLSVVLMIVVEIAILCFKKVSRTVPTNYICLGIFTITMSYLVSGVCSAVKQTNGEDGSKIVLIAALMTLGVVLALTLYAFKTKTDFTMMGGLLFCFSAIMMIFGIFLIFQYSRTADIIYSAMGCFLFSIYLIYDTQLIVGSRRYELELDDYVIGALVLYIDIIGLFLKILSLLSKK